MCFKIWLLFCVFRQNVHRKYNAHFTWHAHGQSTYELPVEESLVCGPPTNEHSVSGTKKENLGVPSAQPQTQQCQAAQSLSPAWTLKRKVPQSVPPAQQGKLKFSVS